MLPVDNHVHSEWSWDAVDGSMRRTCEAAIEIGLPAVAFTDHIDFVDWRLDTRTATDEQLQQLEEHGRSMQLDLDGYAEALESCRQQFPDLRIFSGIEVGEPHIFDENIRGHIGSTRFDRILGSLHSIYQGGELVYVTAAFKNGDPFAIMRAYLQELYVLVEGSDLFEILAHMDYPVRAWSKTGLPFDEFDFEDEYRAVLRSLAGSGRILEINTSGAWPAPRVVRWWYEEGGAAVSFGSDAHRPGRVGHNFKLAVDIVESAGFKPGRHRLDFWRR